MYYCIDCWRKLLAEEATPQIVNKFGVTEEVDKELAREASVEEILPCPTRLGICRLCGGAGEILRGVFSGVILKPRKKTDETTNVEQKSKSIRTMDSIEYGILQNTVALMKFHQQAIDKTNDTDCEKGKIIDQDNTKIDNQRRLPKLLTNFDDQLDDSSFER